MTQGKPGGMPTPMPTPEWYFAEDLGCIGTKGCEMGDVVCVSPDRIHQSRSFAKWPERAALIVRAVNAHERLVEALFNCIVLIEAAHSAGVEGYEIGHDDVELTADGKYRLSDARAALKLAEETEG